MKVALHDIHCAIMKATLWLTTYCYIATVVNCADTVFIGYPKEKAEGVVVPINADSSIFCGASCSETTDCVAVNFDTVTKECELLLTQDSKTASLFTQNDWTFFSKECPAPSIGRGSVVTTDGGRIRSIATHTCDATLVMLGDTPRTCQLDRTWSGTRPTCLSVCQSLPLPQNGWITYSNDRIEGSQVHYKCNPTYGVYGSASKICLQSGLWSGSPTDCVPVCPTVVHPTNSYQNTTLYAYIGSTITRVCYPDFYLVGDKTIECLPSRNWNGTVPICVKDCQELNEPLNGYMNTSDDAKFNSTATYSCTNGLTLSGDATRTCTSSGTWNGTEPTCV